MKIFRLFALAALMSSAAFAQGRGNGHYKHDDRGQDHGRGPDHDRGRVRTSYTVTDRRSDARVITTWYRAHPVEYRTVRVAPRYVFEPRRIVRTRALPVEYRTYVRPVPYALVTTLPRLRPGWDYVMLNDEVLVVDRPSWTVIDIVVRL